MGKWDGKRQAARRASHPKGRLRRSQTAGFGLRPNRPAGGSGLLRKFWSRESAGFPARQGAGEGRCRGQAKRGRPAAPRKSKAKWRACSLLGMGLLQGVGCPKGASAPPKPAALPPRPSCGRPALRAPRPRGNSAKIQGYFGSRPSRRQVASRLCFSCAR